MSDANIECCGRCKFFLPPPLEDKNADGWCEQVGVTAAAVQGACRQTEDTGLIVSPLSGCKYFELKRVKR